MYTTEKETAAMEAFEKATIELIFAICEKYLEMWKRGLLSTKEYERLCREDTRAYRATLGKGTRLDFSDSFFPCITRAA